MNKNTDITRRRALASAGAAAGALALVGPALATAPQSDDELVRMGAEFNRLYAEWLPIHKDMRRLSGVADKAWKAKNISFDGDAYFAVHDETGYTAAIERNDAALDSIDVVAKKIRELPATGFAGLAVKVRVVRFDVFCLNDFDGSEEDMDWEVECFQRFAAEIERLAA